MEVNYKTDLYSSYLLINVENNLDYNKYSFKMLEKNKIKGVLACKHRMEDGKSYLYLDITGKKSLYQEYRDREMSFQEMTELFQDLVIILESMRDFLLTEKMAIIEPEFIYRDNEGGTLHLAVIPWEREEEYPLRKLAEFFLEKINHLEENGMSAAYHFYRSQSQPHFSIYQFLPVLEKENILSRQKEGLAEDDKTQNKKTGDEIKDKIQAEMAGDKTDCKSKKEEDTSFLWIFSFLSAFGILAMVFLPFTQKNQKLGCLVLSVLLFLIGMISRISEKNKKKKPISPDSYQEEEEIFEKEEETVFFMDTGRDKQLCLKWKERGVSKKTEINQLPFTIGKKKDQVSLALSDASVSRLHCRIVEQEGEPAIMDLGSTNGTYLNGIRLNQEDILQIEKNDEILIGKVKLLVV